MEMTIDDFNDVAQWKVNTVDPDTNPIEISVNEFSEHIVFGSKSMRVKIPTFSNGRYFERVYEESIDVTGCENLRFFVSKYYRDVRKTVPARDYFSLKVAVGNTTMGVYTQIEEWYVPILGKCNLNTVNIEFDGITSFNTIRFTVIGDEREIWWIDHIIACTEEFVVDSILAVRDALNLKLEYPLGVLGVSKAAGSKVLTLPSWANVSKYSVLQISEGTKSERHVVAGEVSNGAVEFSDETMFDGPAFINSFTAAAVISMVVPAVIAGRDTAMLQPAIYISGLVPILQPEGFFAPSYDSYMVSQNKRRCLSGARTLKLPVQIEVQCAFPEVMVNINNFIQKVCSDDATLLIGGIKHSVTMEDVPSYDPGDLEGEIPFTIHNYSVEVVGALNVKKSYITIPGTYILNFNVYPN